MIDFRLTDEQRQFQALARQFARDVIIPAAARHDQDESFPEEVVALHEERSTGGTGSSKTVQVHPGLRGLLVGWRFPENPGGPG